MAHPLDSCFRRLNWAENHLTTLHSKITNYLKGQPYAFPREREHDYWHLFRIEVIRQPRMAVSFTLGDFVHNTRSALDHLIWKLVRANGETPGRHNAFPVNVTEDGWLRDVENRSANRGPDCLKGISDPCRAVVKDLQPFNRGDRNAAESDRLFLLHWLSVVDKHRDIHPVMTLGHYQMPQFTLSPAGVVELGNWEYFVDAGMPLENGAKLMRVEIIPISDDAKVDVEIHLPLEVAFSERAVTFPELQFIHADVVDVIKRFRFAFKKTV